MTSPGSIRSEGHHFSQMAVPFVRRCRTRWPGRRQVTGAYFTTGMQGAAEGDGVPLPVTPDLLQRGQERYNIYCTPCHSRTGYGQGMIVQRGYQPAASFHTERLRQAPLGHFFNVITNGYGAMPDYAAQLTPEDRWAVVAYIRALQLSQNARMSDAAGQHAAPLAEIASRQGMPPGFADMNFWRQRAPARPMAAAEPKPAQTPALGSASQTVGTLTTATPASVGSAVPAGKKAEPLGSEALPGKEAVPTVKLKPSAGSIAVGKQVYQANCSICHQDDLTGRPPKIPALAGVVTRTGEEHVRDTITNGAPDARPMMPAFGDRLSAEDITNLIVFLKSFKGGD